MIFRTSCFDPTAVMESGQCFRMWAAENSAVEVIASGNRAVVKPLGQGRFELTGSGSQAFWRRYFDLGTSYTALMHAAPEDDAFLRRAMRCGRGLRILRQEPWETLVCFLISQRKSIPAIRTCVEALCERYGAPIAGCERHAFPTAERLCEAGEDGLRACGLGYRAPYVYAAAFAVATKAVDLQAIAALDDAALFERLTAMSGVGVKVASCVMLFGYHRLGFAPVDVWIQRVIDEEYGGCSPFEAYGANAGVYQQYLFVLKRGEGRRNAG